MATPARTAPSAKTRKQESNTDFVTLVSQSDDGEDLVVKLFGEEFSFNTRTNGWLLMLGMGGDLGALTRLVHSMINVPASEGTDPATAAYMEKRRFDDLLATQQDLTIEGVSTMIGELIALAGNARSDTSDA